MRNLKRFQVVHDTSILDQETGGSWLLRPNFTEMPIEANVIKIL